jgi:tight adherence protein B
MIAGIALPESTLLLAALVGLGVFTIVVGLFNLVVPTAVEQRLAGFVGTYRPARSGAAFDPRGRTGDILGLLDRQLRRRQQGASTRLLLVRANAAMSVAELAALRLGIALLAGALAAFVGVPRFGLLFLAAAVVAGLLGSFLPIVFLRMRAGRRLAALEAQLPDTLDLLTSSLQAGGALTQSFALIARDVPAPMSEEFQRILREIEVGLSTGEALTNFSERVGSDDLDLVVTTVNIQSRVGGNLVQILRTITATIRDRSRIRGEVKVLTAQQKMSGYVISAVPVMLAVFMFLVNPSYIGRLFQPGIGLVLLVVSVIMALAGFLVLQKLTDIEF